MDGVDVRADETTLVLLPGLLCDGRLWRHQVECLGDVTRVVVANLTVGDSVSGMARAVLGAAPAGRFALAGLSMGGYVALEVMRVAPGRVSRLALLDTSARADTPEQTAARRALISTAQEGRFDEVPWGLFLGIVHPDRVGDESLASTVFDMAEAVGASAFVRRGWSG